VTSQVDGLIQRWLSRDAWNVRLARVERPELEQAALRVAIVGLVLAYLFYAAHRDARIDPHEIEVIWVALATVLRRGSVPSHRLCRRKSVVRRLLGMVADNGVTTYCMIQMNEAGAIIIGVYLFVTFGNGFRYGALICTHRKRYRLRDSASS